MSRFHEAIKGPQRDPMAAYRERTVEIARREGVNRARVTQFMGMVRLAPLMQEEIFASPGTLHSRPVTERMLRPIGAIANQHEQLQEFNRLLV